MPKVHKVQRAQKPKPECDVKVGDTYYWWSNMVSGRGVRRCSKTYPTRSQLTMSEFWQDVYGIQDDMGRCSVETAEDLTVERDDWAQRARDVAQETQDKLDNMPDSLRDGDVGTLMQERIEAMEAWADDIENVDIPDRDDFDEGEDGDEEFQDALTDTISEIASLDVSCS